MMNQNYYGADPNAVAAQQLANLFANSVGTDRFGLDQIGADSLAADALAADMLFGADPTPQNAQYRAQAHANLNAAQGGNPALGSANMQQLQRRALAMAAGQVPFSATGEQSTQVKTELLPIVPTLIPAGVGGNAGLLAPASFTFAITPTRSMQINSIMFPSLDGATAGCVLMGLSILGVDQMNGPGGVPCSLLTEVRTHRILKGGTAQAGQQILITIGNTTAVDLVIRGTLEGPDLVRVT
ncbi:MAG: hypothetical protein WC565_10415 [Parcubacteria group bacterium]